MRIDREVIKSRIDELEAAAAKAEAKARSGVDGAFGAAFAAIAVSAEMNALQTVFNAIKDDSD